TNRTPTAAPAAMETRIRIPYAASRSQRGRRACGMGTSGDAMAVRASILPQLSPWLANRVGGAERNGDCTECNDGRQSALRAPDLRAEDGGERPLLLELSQGR